MAVTNPQTAVSFGAAAGTSVASPSFTPTSGNFLVCIATSHDNSTTALSISDSFGLGWTWTERVAFASVAGFAPDAHYKAWTAPVTGSPGAGTVTVDSGAVSSNGWNIAVFELGGDENGFADSDATSGSAGTSTTGTLAGTSGNAVVALCVVDLAAETSLAPSAPLAETDGGSDTSPTMHVSAAFSATADATPAFTWTSSLDFLAVFIEIAATSSSASGWYLDMMQRRRNY